MIWLKINKKYGCKQVRNMVGNKYKILLKIIWLKIIQNMVGNKYRIIMVENKYKI